MDKKTIRIKYIGFWRGFPEQNNFLYDLLSERYNVVVCDDADYAFVSAFEKHFEACTFPGIRIFFSGENMPPDFALHDYGISFDRMTYGDRYLRFPIGLTTFLPTSKYYHPISPVSPAEKDYFAVFMYSHEGTPRRTELFYKLSEYKPVVSTGKYLHNTDMEIPQARGRGHQIGFESKAKFVIACENSSFPGYVTEKLDVALAARSIPIYYGDPTVTSDFNPKAFINCLDYPSLDDVLKRVIEIDQNDELYEEMVRENPYNEENYVEKKEEELKAFLYHIFDQDYKEAFRRPMDQEVNYSRRKEEHLKAVHKYETLLDPARRLRNSLRAIPKKIGARMKTGRGKNGKAE